MRKKNQIISMIDFINRELATLAVFISTIIHHTQFLIVFFYYLMNVPYQNSTEKK